MPKARVLVIDDDPMITQLLHEHLSNEGYDVAEVHLAEEGFEQATQSPPDLIFLDVMLPDATGFQMLGRFRQNSVTRSVPIIMMSGTARHANQLAIGKSMGANAYVLKPFDVIKVGDQVQQLLKGKIIPERGSDSKPVLKREPRREEEEPLSISNPAITEPADAPNNDLPAMPPIANPKRTFSVLTYDTPALKHDLAPVAAQPEPDTKPEMETVFKSDPDLQPAAAPAQAPLFKRVRAAGLSGLWLLRYTASVFLVHMVLTCLQAEKHVFQAVTFTVGGWVLLLGLMVVVCAVLKISLSAEEAIGSLGWAATPIVMHALGNVMGAFPHSPDLPSAIFWLRPLDIFELASLTILGITIRRLPGSSTLKSLIAAFLIALAWCLTGRGYFRP